MKLHHDHASIFVPDQENLPGAVERTTHLGIGAHQDDLEIMAFHGIGECYGKPDKWFGGITCTNGKNRPRTGKWSELSGGEIGLMRKNEQDAAAALGNYGFMAQLGYSSASVMDTGDRNLESDIVEILRTARPSVVYTHNPADKHDTHVRIAVAAINAVRELPDGMRPETLLGCEVWRGLDWMQDGDKIPLDVSDHHSLGEQLIGVYQSQLGSGKRYDLATGGRRHANASFLNPYRQDEATQLIFAMDLDPLIKDQNLKIIDFVADHIRRFQLDVEARLEKFTGKT